MAETLPSADLIECSEFERNDFNGLVFSVRQLLAQRRQFAVTFDEMGNAQLSAPNIGNRNPKTPQPQPPISQAMALAA